MGLLARHPHMHPEGCHSFMAEGRYPLAGHAFTAVRRFPFTLTCTGRGVTHSRLHDFIVSALDDVRRQSSRRGLRSKRGVVLLNNNSFKGVCPGGPLCRGTIL